MIEITNLESLAEKTVFLSLKFGKFGNIRRADVKIETTANESRFHHNKTLLDSPEFKAIGKADLAVKTLVDSLCLPESYDAGIRFLPRKSIKTARNILKEYQDAGRPALIAALVSVWDDQVKAAELELKEHFDPKYYPAKEDVAKEFTFDYQFITFGTPKALQEIDPEIYEEEIQKAHAHIMEAAEQVVLAMRATAHGLVSKLADGLSGTSSVDGAGKKLRDSQVTHLKEFINGFDIKNVGNDSALKSEMDKLALLLEGVDIEHIRNSDTLKVNLAEQVQEIAKSVAVLADIKPGRKFRDTVLLEETAPENNFD